MSHKKDIEKIKEMYNSFGDALPPLEEIDEDFNILKNLSENSVNIIKDVRNILDGKLIVFMRFIENFRNPAHMPLFMINLSKNLNESDLKNMQKIYDEMAEFNIWGAKLELIYSKEDTMKFIRELFSKWQIWKKQLYDILDKKNVNTNDKKNPDINYFS